MLENQSNKAAEMQQKMQALQQQLAQLEIEGAAGGEMVKVILNGQHEAKKVEIDPSLLTQPQVLCDLIASAITAATRKANVVVQNIMLRSFQESKLPENILKQIIPDTQSK